jgi:hypothetical protein
MSKITYKNRSYPVYEAVDANGNCTYRATSFGIANAKVPMGGTIRLEARQDESNLSESTRALYDAIYEAGVDPDKIAILEAGR